MLMMIRNKFNINQHFLSISPSLALFAKLPAVFPGVGVGKNMLILETGASVTPQTYMYVHMTGAQRSRGNYSTVRRAL